MHFKRVVNKDLLIILFFVTVFLSDCYNSFHGEWDFNFSHIVKGIGILVAVFFYLKYKGFDYHLTVVSVVTLSFFTSWIIENIQNETTTRDLYLSIATVLKYLSPFFFFLMVKIFRLKLKYIEIFLTSVFFIVSFASIMAWLLEIEFFRTYSGARFGYKALLASQNEASFFYQLGSLFFYYQFTHNRGGKINLFFLFMVIVASSVLGTKAAYLGNFIFLFFVLITNRKLGVPFLISFILVFCVLGAFLYFGGHIDFYLNLAKNEGLAFMLTSTRNTYLTERLPEIIADWSWINVLFGEFKYLENLLEMDVVDLILFFGLIGSVLYFFALRGTLFSFKQNSLIGWLLVIQFVVIGGLAGHVFASGINAMYLSLICYNILARESECCSQLSDNK